VYIGRNVSHPRAALGCENRRGGGDLMGRYLEARRSARAQGVRHGGAAGALAGRLIGGEGVAADEFL
jgi:hypothetical protein